MGLSEFCYLVVVLCLRWQMSVTSWVRSFDHNRDVGGNDNSLHLWGLAVDVVPDNWDNIDEILRDIKSVGLHYLVHKGHIHIQSRGVKKRR